MYVTFALMVKSIRLANYTITQRVITHGCTMVNLFVAAGIKKASLFLINVKMSYTVNLIKRGSIMYHIKHQKTVRAINRAKHKQAQNSAKRAKRLDCKLTMNVIFVSKNSIVI